MISIAQEGIEISKKITALREADMGRIQSLGKREATSGVRFLQELFKDPITSNGKAATIMQLSRVGAVKLIDRFVNMGILHLRDDTVKYGKTFAYGRYIDIFNG